MTGENRQFCGNCGTPAGPGLRFCERCGTPLGPGASRGAPVSGTGPTMHGNSHLPSMHGHSVPQPPAPSPDPSIQGGTVPLGPGSSRPPPPKPTMPIQHAPPSAMMPYGPPPTFHPTPPKRRWWAAIPLLLVIAVVTAAVVAWFGFPLETKQLLAQNGLRTGVGKSRVAGFPAEADGPTPHFRRRLVKRGAAPAELDLATPVYRVEASTPSAGPYEISLPLLDPERRKRIVIGRRTDDGWAPLPTARDGDHVIASTEELGTFAGFFAKRRSSPEGDDRETMRVGAPRLLFGRVEGDRLTFHVDVRGLDTAVAPDDPWSERVAVRGLHVEVARPGQPFAAYAVEGGNLLWSPNQAVGILPIARAPVDAGIGPSSTLADRAWRLRIHPVFEDGTTGPPSEEVTLFPELLRFVAQRIATTPWPTAAHTAFARNAADHPLTIMVGAPHLENAYLDQLEWQRSMSWGWIRSSMTGPQIGLDGDAPWSRATHAYGHYAVHMALGDAYVEAAPADAPAPWRARTRTVAFAEDLATYLAQPFGGEGSSAGAMRGHPTDLARHPDGVEGAWPGDRGLDALAVETVPATVMARVGAQVGHGEILRALLASRATELLGLLNALAPAHLDVARRVALDEGVSWRVSGRVTRGGQPVAGAEVTVRGQGETTFEAPAQDAAGVTATTGADGRFVVRVPYGDVTIVATEGRATSAPVPFRADTSVSTAAEPQALPSDLLLP